MYDNYESQWTMNRAAYGDSAATMMASQGGRGGGGGYPSGDMDPLSRVGGMIRPMQYTPPMQTTTGFYGMHQVPTGFLRSAASLAFGNTPQGMYTQDYDTAMSRDLGSRFAHGVAGAGVMAGGLAAGGAMSVIGGLGMIGTLGVSAIAMGVAGSVTSAVNQRSAMSDFLGQTSYRFVGAGNPMADARLGRGMSVSARKEATEHIRGMEVKDPYLNMEDMSNILNQGVTSGMFNGTRDMDDFKRKFKDITEAVKVVTKTLGQTLEEGMQTLRDLKSIGVDPSQAKSMVTSAAGMGMVAGRTASEMIGIGMQGAEAFRGTGITMGIGMQGTMMNLASVRAARDAGLISSEAVAQMGGEEAIALRQNAQGVAFAQSGMGRGFNAAFFGNGSFDANAFKSAMAGNGSIADFARQAAGNLSSPAQLIAYQANQTKFQSEMGAMYGGTGFTMASNRTALASARMLSESTGASMKDSFKLSLMEQGLSESDANIRVASIENAQDGYDKQMAGARQMLYRQRLEESEQGRILNRAGAKISDAYSAVIDSVAKPLWSGVVDLGEGISKGWDKLAYGIESASVGDMQLVTTKADVEVLNLKNSKKNIQLDKGGWFSETIGESVNKVIQNADWAKRLGVKTGRAIGEGNVELEAGYNITREEFDRIGKEVSSQWVSAKEANAAKPVGGPSLGKLARQGALDNISSDSSIESVASAILGKNVDNYLTLTRDEKIQVRQASEGSATLRGIFEKKDQEVQVLKDSQGALDSRSAVEALQDREKAIKDLKSVVQSKNFSLKKGTGQDTGGNFSEAVIAKMIQARGAQGEDREKLLEEATTLHMKNDKRDLKDVRGDIDIAMEHGEKYLATASQSNAQIMRSQSKMANRIFVDSADAQLSEQKLPSAERDKILAVVTDLAGQNDVSQFITGALDKGNSDLLDKTTSGQIIKKQGKALQGFLGLTGKSKDDINAYVKENFSAASSEGKQRIIDAISTEEGKVTEDSIKKAANVALEETRAGMGPKDFSTANSGAGLGMQGTSDKAMDTYNKTVAVQEATLQVLLIMKDQLKK